MCLLLSWVWSLLFCFWFSLQFAFSLPVNLFLRIHDGMTRETQILPLPPHYTLSVLRSILGAVMLLALSVQCGEGYLLTWSGVIERKRFEDSEERWSNCLLELMEELASSGLKWLLGLSEEATGGKADTCWDAERGRGSDGGRS